MKEILLYFINPIYKTTEKISIFKLISVISKLYFLTFTLIFLNTLLINNIDNFLSKIVNSSSIKNEFTLYILQYKKINYYIYFFTTCLYAPFIEELIFRLPLSTKITHICISMSIIFYIIIGGKFIHFEYNEYITYFEILISIIFFLLLKKYFKKNILINFNKKYFKHFFYLSCIIFGIVHLSNNPNIKIMFLPIYLIYILPQIIMGFSFAYLRVHYGLFASFLMHFFINLLSFIIKIS